MIIETTEIKIVVVKPLNKNFKLVNPSILLGDKISQLSSLLPHEVRGKIKSKKIKFLTLEVIKNNKKLKNIALIKQGRLSVMPLKKAEWDEIVKISKY